MDGKEIPRSWLKFTLPLKAGGTTTGRFRHGLRDTVPSFTVDGTSYPLGPQIPVWLGVLAMMPLSLVLVGGLLGGLTGIVAWSLNLRIATQDIPVPVQALAMVAMSVSSVAVYLGFGPILFGN